VARAVFQNRAGRGARRAPRAPVVLQLFPLALEFSATFRVTTIG
jgi:hypothetical protein